MDPVQSQYFKIDLVIFPFELHVFFGERDELFHEVVDMDLSYGSEVGRTIMTESNGVVLWMPKTPCSPEDFAVLQHEIFHAVDMLYRRIGIKLSRHSDEAYAYMIGYITKEIYGKCLLKSSSFLAA